jgi:hypothetical protein
MGTDLVAGILKSIENLTNINTQTNINILTSINKTNTILTDEINSELKKQTTLLESILKGITDTISQELKNQTNLLNPILKSVSDKSSSVSFSLFSGGSGKAITALLGFTAPKRLKAMANSFDLITESISKLVDVINKLDESKLKSLMEVLDVNIGKKILIFAGLVALAAPLMLIGTIITLPALFLWVKFFEYLGKDNKDVSQGMSLLQSIAISIGVLVLTIVASAFVLGDPMNLVIASILVGATIFVIVKLYDYISQKSKQLKEGAKQMMWLALTTGILVAVIIAASFILGDPTKLVWATLLVASVLAIVGGVYILVSMFAKQLKEGGKQMLWLALTTALIVGIIVATAMFGGGSEKLKETAFLIAGALMGIVVIFLIAGALEGTIKKGAIAMILSSIALGIIVFSLIKFKEAKVTWEDLGMLSSFVVGLGTAMALAGVGALFIGAGAAVMLLAGAALYVITASLVNFKKSNWKEPDNELLSKTITGIITTFKTVFADLSLSDFAEMMAGATLLATIGNSLTYFAQGLSSFANLEFSTYQTDSKGNIISTKKEGTINPEEVAKSITTMINAVKEPLRLFGEENGESGFFRDGPVLTGIILLGKLGNSLSEFAKGISAFANLEFVQYKTDEKGNLVVDGSTKGKIDTVAISEGIKTMISATTAPLEELGGKKGGWFSSSDYEKGLDMLKSLGDPIFKISETAKILSEQKIDSTLISQNLQNSLGSFIGILTSADMKKINIDKSEDVVDLFGDFTKSLIKIKPETTDKMGNMFVKMKESINGIDLSKLKKLNDLAYNLSEFAKNMRGSFADLEKVLERLATVVNNISDIKVNTSTQTKSVQKEQPVKTQVETIQPTKKQMDFDISAIVNELESIKKVLLSGIEVDVKDSMLKR